MGFDHTPSRARWKHAPVAAASSATAVPLAFVPTWVTHLVLQADDDNPAGQKSLFGDSTVSPTSYGLFCYPGDMVPWPHPGPIPVHQLYYYQVGGAGEVRWLGTEILPG